MTEKEELGLIISRIRLGEKLNWDPFTLEVFLSKVRIAKYIRKQETNFAIPTLYSLSYLAYTVAMPTEGEFEDMLLNGLENIYKQLG